MRGPMVQIILVFRVRRSITYMALLVMDNAAIGARQHGACGKVARVCASLHLASTFAGRQAFCLASVRLVLAFHRHMPGAASR